MDCGHVEDGACTRTLHPHNKWQILEDVWEFSFVTMKWARVSLESSFMRSFQAGYIYGAGGGMCMYVCMYVCMCACGRISSSCAYLDLLCSVEYADDLVVMGGVSATEHHSFVFNSVVLVGIRLRKYHRLSAHQSTAPPSVRPSIHPST